VNCVAPGVILTDMCANVDPEILAQMGEDNCVGRNGTPEDVAKAMAYLADAEFVTGHVLNVDGGYVM
jgi:3-oxoacyl-[acyl-carrier protein] reductase